MLRNQNNAGLCRLIYQRLNVYFHIVMLCSVFLYSSTGVAKNLGTIGITYTITETDFLEMIQRKLHEKQTSGELKTWQQQFQEESVRHILRPTPVGLTTTMQPKTFYFDPTLKLQQPIKDHLGNILIKAGTTFNPLTVVSWHKVLFFLDADDRRQVDWLTSQIKSGVPFKIILVKGDIKAAEEHFQQPIYFDQQGRLSKHFHLQHIPCLIESDGLRLKIREFALHDQ